MKLGVFTVPYGKLPLAEALDRLAAMGVEAVELEERAHRLLPSEWLMRLAESTTATTTRPGSTVSHHEVAT